MIVSYKWLQEYFDAPLPPPEKVAELFIFHAFEVESVEEKNDDFIFDLKVLPDRAHDCLSHRGVARELAAMLDVPISDKRKAKQITAGESGFSVSIEDETLCRRYVGAIVEGVKVGPSPAWLKEKLEATGQRSINNIVDATNFVMFDIGQPLHAFDKNKVEGGIVVRKARQGEKITTFDGKEVPLDESVLVIASDSSASEPLAIAGVKGGKNAEVNTETTALVLEAANFNPTMVRKISQRLGIRTDSSKRFENEITPELAHEAMDRLITLVLEVAGGAVVALTDVYPKRPNPYKLGFTSKQINAILGTKLSDIEIGSYLNRLGLPFEKMENPREKIIARVKELVGAEYAPVGTVQFDAPARFSCSSLVNYAYVEAGIALPSISIDQYAYGASIGADELLPGDLIFANSGVGSIRTETVQWMTGTKVPEGVDHVGMFLGDNKVIHATRSAGKVVVETISESISFKNIVGYRRISDADASRVIVTVPPERLDLRILENIAEEVGRLYGYKNLETKDLGELGFVPQVNKAYYYAEKIRDILVGLGFSEVKTYTFFDEGEVVLVNPFASDKSHLRTSLQRGLTDALALNSRNAPLLGLDDVKVFEIGSVFPSITGEHIALGIGISLPMASKNKDSLIGERFAEVKEAMGSAFGVAVDGFVEPYASPIAGSFVIEVDINRLVAAAPEQKTYDNVLIPPVVASRYKTFSLYPFIARDVAVFVPPDVSEEDVAETIIKEAGDLRAQGPTVFDRFEKKNKETGEVEKISYAFRMVFQSPERTLTDDEVNEIMNRITASLHAHEGWQVR